MWRYDLDKLTSKFVSNITRWYRIVQNFDDGHFGVRKNLMSKILTNCISLSYVYANSYWKKTLKFDELLQ